MVVRSMLWGYALMKQMPAIAGASPLFHERGVLYRMQESVS